MPRTRPNRSNRGSVASLVITVISAAAAAVLFINRQAIIDQISVWQFQPSVQIQSFASRAAMSSKGQFLFYASQPSLDDRQVFAGHCPNADPNTSVLGCYAAQRIHIYDVNNAQLPGIRTVTAAHEMLHAAYDRLSATEQRRVNALLEAEYAKLKNDASLTSLMAFYAKTEPGQRDNELHSVIGTEIAAISPELEAYYSQYFSDRQKVVGLYASYQGVFNDLQAKAAALNAQLTTLSATIQKESDTYNQQVNQLNADIASFNQQASSGAFTDQAQFNQRRAALVVRVKQLTALRSKVNADIALYNRLQSELSTIASQYDQLNKSINSSLAPAPSL